MRAPRPLLGMVIWLGICEPGIAQGPLSAAQEQALKAKDSFKECDACPEMLVVPAGAFAMGSPKNERVRADNEGPQHRVAIGKAFALGKLEVTVDQFAGFVTETSRQMGATCDVWQDGRWSEQSGRSWRDPGFAQSGSHPVACISWEDAKAYAAWLSGKTGKAYRLPTEAEWEYAARGGTTTRFHFGNAEKDYCRYGNGADQAARKSVPGADKWKVLPCNDGNPYTAPVGSFAPNGFGLHDTHGNLFEWTEDCWHDNYVGAPHDGSAWIAGGDCDNRVLRGGARGYLPDYLRVAVRGKIGSAYRYVNAGLRVARTLGP
jgi:formylglycine-generating enzyme required for sulfatase activity